MKIFIISIILIFCFGIGTSGVEEFEIEEIESDYLLGYLKFLINIDFQSDSASIFKIFSTESMSKDFIPDFIGYGNFVTTDIWREEYNKNITQIIDGEIKSTENRLVFIATTKEELDYIEKKYINSKYLKELDEDFFDENILVIILFHFTGWQYPKNWRIENYNGKYIFITEIWNQNKSSIILLAQRALFLIKIEK